MKDEHEHITDLLNRRSDLLQLVLVAAVLSIGINLFSSWLVQSQGFSPYVWIVALFLIISSIVWLAIIALRHRYFFSEIKASFLLDIKHNRLVSFSEYDFSRDFYIMLNGVLKENKAFQEIWDQSPLVPLRKSSNRQQNRIAETVDGDEPQYVFITKVAKGDDAEEYPKSAALVIEAVEFLLIHELSMHLSGYFDDQKKHEKYIKEYKRNDIPELLLQNRVLDLLTRPFDEREPFIRFMKEHHDIKGEIHTIFGKDGTVYDRFHLHLPTETKLRRFLPGMLEFENNRISLLLTVRLEGFSTSRLSNVVSLYKRANPDEVVAYNVNIGLHYRVKARSLLSRSGWEYYRWVDSFVSEMTRKLSLNEYLHRANWDTVALVHKVLTSESTAHRNPKEPESN